MSDSHTESAVLCRAAAPELRPAAPIRIVHLGLGAFARAHLAWYTALAPDARDWGIAMFTGRSATQAELLQPQDGLYTLIERHEDGDRLRVIDSVVAVRAGSDSDAFTSLVAASSTAIVSLTITEAGYHLAEQGIDRTHPDVAEDIHTLRHEGSSFPRTAPARLLYGLRARFDNGGAPLAIVPCDNLPGNGSALRGALLDLADVAGVADDLAAWLRAEVSFVNTSVDRITPRTTDADIAVVRDAGWVDAAPVVTEPFSDWVLSGFFPAGRPAWEQAGARFVDDIELFERRKLWLLNGAHTTLASAGTLRSLETVADAFADPHCRDLVEAFWADAALALPPEADAVSYVERLRQRFSARRMRHLLSQISQDAAAKSRVRILPVAQALGFDPRVASGCVAALASVAEATGEPVDSLLGQGDGSVAFLEFQAAVVDVAPVRNLL